MDDFSKIFSDKLHNYKTPPPAQGWEQLNAALDEDNKRRKKVIYWRVAAAIVLLFLAGTGWWSMKGEEQPLAQLEEKSPEIESPVAVQDQTKESEVALSIPDKSEAKSLEENAVTDIKEAWPSQSSPVNTLADKSMDKEVKEEENQAVDLQQKSMLAESTVQEAAVPDQAEDSREQITTLEAVSIEPLAPDQEDLVAMESVSKVNIPVTIIYKPGVSDRQSDVKGIAKDLLDDIKNTNISFSEIRSAKAELLAKVFSKKDNEVSP